MEHRSAPIHLAATLAEGKRWIIGAAIAGVLVGAILVNIWPKNYEASAVMTLDHSGSQSSFNMETQRLIASSTAVMAHAANELGTSAGNVRSSVSVRIPPGAVALEFFAERPTADSAAAFANATADAYLVHVTAANGTSRNNETETLRDRISQLEEELANESADSSRAQALQERLAESELALVDAELGPADATISATLVSPAQPPPQTSTPGLAVFIAGGLTAGALLGACLAVYLKGRQNVADPTDAEFHDIVQGYK